MLKKHKLCKVCAELETNAPLLNRIYNSKFFMKTKGESLAEISREYDTFTYENLKNHVKKHQFLSADDYSQRHLRQIAKEAEKSIVKHAVESKEVWDEVIGRGMEKLQKGEITMKTADLLKAAKDKSDYEFKVKDQQMAMMEMVYHFASGESDESKNYDRRIIEGKAVTHHDPAEGTTADTRTGETGPNGVYYPAAWDAAPSGTDQIPQGSPEWQLP